MKLNKIFKHSATNVAIVTALSLGLAACGGDINLESNVDNSVGDTVVTNPSPTTPTTPDEVLPGKANSALSTQVSAALGFDVQIQVLDTRITESTTLVANDSNGNAVMYALSGGVDVGGLSANKQARGVDDVVLTIEPGTVVFGQSGNDYLVIHRDAKIMAEGTKTSPIIMTSLQDVQGETTDSGQWGGLVILGNAPSNKCPTDGSDCALQVEGVGEGAVFGGTDWEDDSGALKYLVVKYAGYEIAPDNELNGITFGGVGSGTKVEYIQVHDNADDGVEFFGGTVNAKYVVLTGNKDDSVDWDNGYRGNLQYVLVKHADNNGEANRAIEADNDGSTPNKEPQSNPTIANMTIIGNDFNTADKSSEGIYLREGTKAQLHNFVVTGSSGMGECLEIEGGSTSSVTAEQAENGDTVISNSVFACSENFKDAKAEDGTVLLNVEDWVLNQNDDNSTATDMGTVLNGIFTIDTTTPKDFTGNTFFDNADHIGAVTEGNDWTVGWTVGLE